MGGGLREDEEQEGTHVSLPHSLSHALYLQLVPTIRGSSVVVCGWHPSGQLFASGDSKKKIILWKR